MSKKGGSREQLFPLPLWEGARGNAASREVTWGYAPLPSISAETGMGNRGLPSPRAFTFHP